MLKEKTSDVDSFFDDRNPGDMENWLMIDWLSRMSAEERGFF